MNYLLNLFNGEMAERSIATVLKTVGLVRAPWVRIPLSPQRIRTANQTVKKQT